MLVLKKEITEYTDKTGKQRQYTNVYVEVQGVKVQVKAADRTGQELIQNALDSK